MWILWAGAAALVASIVSARVPKRLVKLWALCLFVLFVWVGCTDRIEYDRSAQQLGQKLTFKRPMAYTKNFNKHIYNELAYKLNCVLQPLEQTDQLWFHNYKSGVKELEYVRSDMTFTILEVYENVPGWLVRAFGGVTRHYVLKDEEGRVSVVWDQYVDYGGWAPNKEFMEEVRFLDGLAESNGSCRLTAVLHDKSTNVGNLEQVKENLNKSLSLYKATVENHADVQGVVTINGNVDAMAFVYSSKLALSIKAILSSTCSDLAQDSIGSAKRRPSM